MTSFAASFLVAAAQCPAPSPVKPGSPPLTGALFGAASASATLAPGAPSGNGISGPGFGDVEMTCAAGGDRALGCNALSKGPETARKSKARKVVVGAGATVQLTTASVPLTSMSPPATSARTFPPPFHSHSHSHSHAHKGSPPKGSSGPVTRGGPSPGACAEAQGRASPVPPLRPTEGPGRPSASLTLPAFLDGAALSDASLFSNPTFETLFGEGAGHKAGAGREAPWAGFGANRVWGCGTEGGVSGDSESDALWEMSDDLFSESSGSPWKIPPTDFAEPALDSAAGAGSGAGTFLLEEGPLGASSRSHSALGAMLQGHEVVGVAAKGPGTMLLGPKHGEGHDEKGSPLSSAEGALGVYLGQPVSVLGGGIAPSPLGLTLKKSPSLLDFISLKLAEGVQGALGREEEGEEEEEEGAEEEGEEEAEDGDEEEEAEGAEHVHEVRGEGPDAGPGEAEAMECGSPVSRFPSPEPQESGDMSWSDMDEDAKPLLDTAWGPGGQARGAMLSASAALAPRRTLSHAGSDASAELESQGSDEGLPVPHLVHPGHPFHGPLSAGCMDPSGSSGGGETAGEKLKASNFPARSIKIGSWERASKYEGDLVAKCYYAKRKLVWEMLDTSLGLKSKMEIQWADITLLRASCPEGLQGTLEIEVSRPPMFFREVNPQPRKHTMWQPTPDFTGGQAHSCKRHVLLFAEGILGKHLSKLLSCDRRLRALVEGAHGMAPMPEGPQRMATLMPMHPLRVPGVGPPFLAHGHAHPFPFPHRPGGPGPHAQGPPMFPPHAAHAHAQQAQKMSQGASPPPFHPLASHMLPHAATAFGFPHGPGGMPPMHFYPPMAAGMAYRPLFGPGPPPHGHPHGPHPLGPHPGLMVPGAAMQTAAGRDGGGIEGRRASRKQHADSAHEGSTAARVRRASLSAADRRVFPPPESASQHSGAAGTEPAAPAGGSTKAASSEGRASGGPGLEGSSSQGARAHPQGHAPTPAGPARSCSAEPALKDGVGAGTGARTLPAVGTSARKGALGNAGPGQTVEAGGPLHGGRSSQGMGPAATLVQGISGRGGQTAARVDLVWQGRRAVEHPGSRSVTLRSLFRAVSTSGADK